MSTDKRKTHRTVVPGNGADKWKPNLFSRERERERSTVQQTPGTILTLPLIYEVKFKKEIVGIHYSDMKRAKE